MYDTKKLPELPKLFDRFSVIDLFSYLLPGAVWIFYAFSILKISPQDVLYPPIDLFFPENWIARSVFLLCISYVLGMILSELSYWLWNKIGKFLFDKIVKPLFNTIGKNNSSTQQQKAETQRQKRQEWIQVLPESELIRKQLLFQGYYEFSRTISAVALTLFLEWWLHGVLSEEIQRTRLYTAVAIVALVLLIERGHRFHKYSDEYREALTVRVSNQSTSAQSVGVSNQSTSAKKR